MRNHRRSPLKKRSSRLSFAYEERNEIPVHEASEMLDIVENLDLSHNSICNVRPLANFDRLHTLILDSNLLTSEADFPPLPSLRILWLNNNEIFDLEAFIPCLARSCPNLRHLSMMGNPGVPREFSEVQGYTQLDYKSYRLFVIGHFSKLEYLDDRSVSNKEREDSDRLSETGFSSIMSILKSKLRIPKTMTPVRYTRRS